jgi:hypothetical protein
MLLIVELHQTMYTKTSGLLRLDEFHKYPPDDQPRAVNTVIEQAEMHAEELV